jgi:hypothetical protein
LQVRFFERQKLTRKLGQIEKKMKQVGVFSVVYEQRLDYASQEKDADVLAQYMHEKENLEADMQVCCHSIRPFPLHNTFPTVCYVVPEGREVSLAISLHECSTAYR